jgi:bifunctional ADP-heptose synthase (sugar kinase/adenylyltransferase)
LCLAAGADKPQAAKIANYAAGIVVGKMGTVPIELDELKVSLKA